MAAGDRLLPFLVPVLDSNGNPVSGAKLYFYEAGTTTPIDTFSDVNRTVANANPIVCDDGFPGDIFLKALNYKIVAKTSADVTLWTQDNVSVQASGVMPSISDYGAVGNGSTDDKPAFDLANTASVPGVVIPDGTYLIGSDVTVDPHLQFNPGAKLKPASGVTVTLAGGYTAAATEQVFDISAGGTIALAASQGGVTAIHFGAVGDGDGAGGGTDDATALNAATATGKLIDLSGLTFRSDSQITLPAGAGLENGAIDFASAGAITCLTSSGGALGTAVALASDAVSGATTVVLADSDGFAADDYVEIHSDAEWSSVEGVDLREIVQVASNDTGTETLTLAGGIGLAFATADNAEAAKITTVSGIVLRDLALYGNGANAQNGCVLTFCDRPKLERVKMRNFRDRGISLDRCIEPKVDDVEGRDFASTGLAYVVVVAGNLGGALNNIRGYNIRHTVTLGGTTGITVGMRLSDIYGEGCRASVFDTHSAARDITCIGVRHVHPALASGENGLTIQGANIRVLACDVDCGGAGGDGVFFQPLVTYGYDSALMVQGRVRNAGTTGFGAEIRGDTKLIEADLEIIDPGSHGAYIRTYASTPTANLERIDLDLNIRGVVGASNYGLFLRNQSTTGIKAGRVAINSARDDDLNSNIILTGTATDTMGDLVFSGVAENGTYGLRGASNIDTGTINTSGMEYIGMATADETGI